jgi:F-type H+-transporting ATPase subunit delta
MITGSVARRYARALMQVAQKTNAVDAFAAELEALATLFRQSRELVDLMVNPAFGAGERRKVLGAILDRLRTGPMVRRFAEMVLERGRIGSLPGMAVAFQEMADLDAGRLRAEVTSAEPLGPGYRQRLLEVLARTTGKEVLLTEKVDASLLGGMVTRVGDKMFDGSLKNRLARLRATLTSGRA